MMTNRSTLATDSWWGYVDRANQGLSGAGKDILHDRLPQWRTLYCTDFRALVGCQYSWEFAYVTAVDSSTTAVCDVVRYQGEQMSEE